MGLNNKLILGKMLCVFHIVLVILVVILIASTITACGTKDKENDGFVATETESFTDTVAPKVTMKKRYIFTNDVIKLNDFSAIVGEVIEESEYTVRLIRYDKHKVLGTMNELALKNLVEKADNIVSKEEALNIGSEEIPTQQGIYRCVLEFADASGNASYEDVFVILDKTPAVINEVDEQVITVTKDKLNDEPELNLSVYKALDNVDGLVTNDKLNIDVTLLDEAKHEWEITISYTDRAGNYSEAKSYITVTEETLANIVNNNIDSTNNNSDSTTPPAMNYNPMDANKDGAVDMNEEMLYITPQKQKCIDAGYGVVVEQDGGKWYSILTNDPDQLFNGMMGHELLDAYLAERGLKASDIGGCWISMSNGWYWYTAENILEIPEDDGEIDWDNIDWEFND